MTKSCSLGWICPPPSYEIGEGCLLVLPLDGSACSVLHRVGRKYYFTFHFRSLMYISVAPPPGLACKVSDTVVFVL